MKRAVRHVPAVGKALDILEYIAAGKQPGSILELAQTLRIPQASAFRLVNTLIERDYLRKRPDDGILALGPRGGLLARQALEASRVRQAVHPFAIALREATGKTVEVTTLENDAIAFVDILESTEPIRYTRTLGAPLIGSTNPITLAILAYSDDKARRRVLARMAVVRSSYLPHHPELAGYAFSKTWDARLLDAIRKQGYTADYGEQTKSVTRIAAPLLEGNGRVIGTLGIAGPHFLMPADGSGNYIKEVLSAANRFHAEHPDLVTRALK
jgi:DNA-binding IclR family transcriptional regulator